MKKMITAIIFILMTTTANAGASLWGIRGELWQKNSEFEKFLYVQGVLDGLVFSDFTINDTKLTTNIDALQYVKAINKLYEDYRNTLIPVPFLMRIVTLQINGDDDSAIEDELKTYRAKFSKK